MIWSKRADVAVALVDAAGTVPTAVLSEPVEETLRHWLALAGLVAAVAGALWSAVQRWNVSLRVETQNGKLRVSASVARREGR